MALLKWLERNYIIKLSKFYSDRTQLIINYLNSLTFGIRTPVQKNVHCNLGNTLLFVPFVHSMWVPYKYDFY